MSGSCSCKLKGEVETYSFDRRKIGLIFIKVRNKVILLDILYQFIGISDLFLMKCQRERHGHICNGDVLILSSIIMKGSFPVTELYIHAVSLLGIQHFGKERESETHSDTRCPVPNCSIHCACTAVWPKGE